MVLKILHGEDTRGYTKEIESSWNKESAERVNRGPCICTSIVVEGESDKPLARLNLYGPQILMSCPPETQVILNNINIEQDRYTAEETKLAHVLDGLPVWAMQDIYIGDVIVLNEQLRNIGIGTYLVKNSLQHHLKTGNHVAKTAVGVTNNLAMLGIIKALGGHVAENIAVLGISEDREPLETYGYIASYKDFTDRKEEIIFTKTPQEAKEVPNSPELLLSEICVRENPEKVGFRVIYDTHKNMADNLRIVGIVVPERDVDTLSHPAIDHEDGLVGQTLVILNPKLSAKELGKYEYDLAEIMISHRWGTVLKRGDIEFTGKYLSSKANTQAFEIDL